MKLTPTDDGRDIDPALGELAGEGSLLRVKVPEHGYPAKREVARAVAPREEREPTYYDQPVLKEPVWIWSIPVYFFVGGLAGASSALASAADALDPKPHRRLVRIAHRVAAAGEVLSAGLLIHDLGRPARFLNMLRVFRSSSPMSVGSWVLSGAGATSTLAVLAAGRRGALGRLGSIAGHASAVFGLPLAGYTAVLIAGTAVPIWQGGRRALPPLFLASSMASAGALLSLLPVGRRGREAARRFSVIGDAATLALGLVFEREVGRVPRVARPLRRGSSGALWSASRALTAGALAASFTSRRTLAPVLSLAGSLALRAAVFLAGKASARDPRATFRQQRAGLGAAEVTAPP
jgi:formate-dependent nitrite reductase membrane component NrfD